MGASSIPTYLPTYLPTYSCCRGRGKAEFNEKNLGSLGYLRLLVNGIITNH